MKRLVLKKYNRLILQEIDDVELKSNEVAVKVVYAGVSFTDSIIQRGWYKYQKSHMPLPYVPDFEASGVVIQTGSDVNTVRAGDKVVVLQRSGCFSEEIVTTPEKLITLPEDTDLAWAASLPVNYFTAYHALHNIVKVFPSSKVLIESASGGVGGMLVQLASKFCSVTGLVGSTSKANYVTSLGAQTVFTYETAPRTVKYDVIFTSSGKNLRQYSRQLNTNGKIVLFGFHSLIPDHDSGYVRAVIKYLKLPKFDVFKLVYNNRTISGFNIIKLDYDSLEYLQTKASFLSVIQENSLTKHKTQIIPVEEYYKAFDLLNDRSRVGKILLSF